MKSWRRIEPTELIAHNHGRFTTVKHFLTPDGIKRDFVVYGKDGDVHSAVIAITADNKVVLAEQFRPGPEKIMFELPGGTINEGEGSAEAIIRELREETGYTSKQDPILLGRIHKDAYMNATWDYYIVYGCEKSNSQELDEAEFVDVKEVSIKKLIDLAKNDLVSDAMAVLLAYERLKEIKDETTN